LESKINQLDKNKSGRVEFIDYIKDTFGDDVEMISKIGDQVKDSAEIRKLYEIERSKWLFISNNSYTMNYQQFYWFIYSDEYPDYQKYEANITFNLFDLNKDNFVSINELLKSTQDFDHLFINTKNGKCFPRTIDLNGDNRLDFEEFTNWYLPNHSQLVEEEQTFLIKNVDDNNNAMLEKNEITKHCDIFLQNVATNFGSDLDIIMNEHQQKFTETVANVNSKQDL
jgi:Ca2+-binding EF-hand superfamily protein